MSQVVMNYYQSKLTRPYQEFSDIENWISKDIEPSQNCPLVISSLHGYGRKLMLANWLTHHKSLCKKEQDIVILHFGMGMSFQQVIYKTLIELRRHLNIGQKVELQSQKLRNYFKYWLSLCDRYIENQVINSAQTIYRRVLIVFEGIDNYVDTYNGSHKANVAIWMPQFFPKNIRVIVTGEVNSQAIQYFKSYDCTVLQLQFSNNQLLDMIDKKRSEDTLLQGSKKQEVLDYIQEFITSIMFIVSLSMVKHFLQLILISKGKSDPKTEQKLKTKLQAIDIHSFDNCQNVNQFLSIYIKQIGKNEQDFTHKFIQILSTLVCSYKGLTTQEILQSTRVTLQELSEFKLIMNQFLIEHKGLLILINQFIPPLIFSIASSTKVKEIRVKIADSLDKTPNSVRKLVELTHQLQLSHNYFRLKEVISQVQNLLLLFNPQNKFLLCRFWEQLQKNNFDPVVEYNKSVEGFQMHYHPSAQDLFLIIVQVSRFLKEFSDFQNFQTLDFRHPEVKGHPKDLAEVRILGQLRIFKLHNIQFQNEIVVEELKDKLEAVLKHFESSQGKHFLHSHQQKKVLQEWLVKKPKLPKMIQKGLQNMQIKSNRDKFSQRYIAQIKMYMDDQSSFDLASIKDLQKLISSKSRYIHQEPSYYYYKRWIWMQFPWVCMSLSCDYSEWMKKCSTSSTQYMSVSDQTKLTIQALKIALQAKRKKQQVLQSRARTKQELLGLKLNQIKERPQKKAEIKKKLGKIQIISKTSFYNPTEYLNINKIFHQKSLYQIKRKINQSKDLSAISFFLTDNQMRTGSQIFPQTFDNTFIPKMKFKLSQEKNKEITAYERNSQKLKRSLNNLVAQNQTLAKQLNKLKIKEFNQLNQTKNLKEVTDLKKQIQNNQIKLIKIKKDYAVSVIQRQRFNILLKVCKYNVNNNQESIRPLVIQSNSLKSMIKYYSIQIQTLKNQLEKEKKKSGKIMQNMNLASKTQMSILNLIAKQKQDKDKFGTKVNQINISVKESIAKQKSILDKLQQDQQVVKPFVLKPQIEVDQVKQSSKQNMLLKQVFSLKSQQNLQQNSRLNKFLVALQRREALLIKKNLVMERNQQLQTLIQAKKAEIAFKGLQKVSSSNEAQLQKLIRMQDGMNTDQRIQYRDSPIGLMRNKYNQKLKQYTNLHDLRLRCSNFINSAYAKFQSRQARYQNNSRPHSFVRISFIK